MGSTPSTTTNYYAKPTVKRDIVLMKLRTVPQRSLRYSVQGVKGGSPKPRQIEQMPQILKKTPNFYEPNLEQISPYYDPPAKLHTFLKKNENRVVKIRSSVTKKQIKKI